MKLARVHQPAVTSRPVGKVIFIMAGGYEANMLKLILLGHIAEDSLTHLSSDANFGSRSGYYFTHARFFLVILVNYFLDLALP